jgi:hypothetical protein
VFSIIQCHVSGGTAPSTSGHLIASISNAMIYRGRIDIRCWKLRRYLDETAIARMQIDINFFFSSRAEGLVPLWCAA